MLVGLRCQVFGVLPECVFVEVDDRHFLDVAVSVLDEPRHSNSCRRLPISNLSILGDDKVQHSMLDLRKESTKSAYVASVWLGLGP